MSEEIPVRAGFHVDEEPSGGTSSDIAKSTENVVGDGGENHRQRIFAERFSALMDGFGEACVANNVDTAIAIAIHPNEPNPIVFSRGNLYDTATLLVKILRILKSEIDDDLKC